MRLAALALLALPIAAVAQDISVPGTVPFEQSVLVEGLAAPWELTHGPDGMLWVTERTGARILRIDPATGQIVTALDVPDVAAPGGQDGLLGLALDPGLLTGSPRVFAAHTYQDMVRPPDPLADPTGPYARLHARIIRLTFDPASGLLSDPVTVIDGLPAGADHNSGRLLLGPDGMLYYSIGDRGHNQFGAKCNLIESQRLPTAAEVAAGDWIAYQGKVLRIAPDGTIPPDNPVIGGVQSHVLTYGHRNPQGLAFGPDGTLYEAEHGPKSDDEVNVLRAGGNYGWPHVSGWRDDSAYLYARWGEAPACADMDFSDFAVPPTVPKTAETEWTEAMQDPLATLFTVPTGWKFQDPKCRGMHFICWPTVAPSSIQVYRPAEPIPGFGNALLVTALKRGSIYRIPLTGDGLEAAGPPERYLRTDNRYRDLAISPDGRTIYVATDPGGLHDTAEGGASDQVANPGAILVFRAVP